ncbi:serine/threonine-protein phosphatase 6 regulatory ankyrin repeat subunit C [Patella vulgata]|uniref:serine/threonine-protein phosphatase 6 regulatory ankyrin repeat subunit C n=1 Tax=Patella vulgata TaxID=6465 RepID=UPI0021808C5E|nr:serine/threonine-protein phosphatase 6 regulatory ankyrin repeat subunit C [Patella vulgata]XP_050404242.1 serine/threonine-protein phosphatase 6 regulatory ankyrin repeat subunit C [Patella vulgata]XP_055956803.1 serine/threonine-protein phosphatase 6 regulatory ankyrin repeat subunit C [Patella vulgata]XP_055956804.1 serine/threonine-protein phosphatase 6 regulatory ankyrin repeat subunit C [Patella vulgata]
MDAYRLLESKLRQAKEDGNIGKVIETLSLQHKTKQALFIAAREGLWEVVIYMLEHGVDWHYVDWHHYNLLLLLLDSFDRLGSGDNRAPQALLFKCVVKLVDAGVDLKQVNKKKEMPICTAGRLGLYDVVMYLLKNGVDVHYDDKFKHTILHHVLAGMYIYVEDEEQITTILNTYTNYREGYEVVIYLVEHGADVHYVDCLQRNLMHLLLVSHEWFDTHDNTGGHNLLPYVVKLVDAGVDVNQLDGYEETPIYIAAIYELWEIVIYLLNHGVDVHYAEEQTNILLSILFYHYKRDYDTGRRDLLLERVFKLIHGGVNINPVILERPIIIAARLGLHEVVMYMLEHGVDVHHADYLQCNILHYVLCHMCSYVEYEEIYIQLVNILINTGLDINQPDLLEGNTPLFYVGKHNFSDNYNLGKLYAIHSKLKAGTDTHTSLKCKLINILLGACCIVNHQNKLGQTALMYYIKHQTDISILKLLIPHSDLSLTDNNGVTAIRYCVQYHMINSTSVFKLLVDLGSDLMSRNNGVKLFDDILKCKRLWGFSYYIKLKLIVNGVTAEGENMLHLLAGVNYDYSLSKFNWLLNNELDINHPCSKTNTPTMIAAFLLNSKYLELLTSHPRLEINTQNNQGHTALHLCIIGFTMFKNGLNKRQVNDVVKNYCRQIYPIYMACIDTLLGVDGIDVNIHDNAGRTSLMMAAMKNDRVLTRKLLQAGAIVNRLDHSGRSALQYIDIYKSLFDLTCFKLLLSKANTGLLNLPCIDGNTIIQTALCFPFFWKPCRVVRFIRYLVAENCCLQTLVTSSVESSYNQIDCTEISSEERDKLRKVLYRSGAQGEEIMTTLNFDEEDQQYEDRTIFSLGRKKFVSFCSNISLKSLCRRIIRQNLGWGIKEKIKNLELPRELKDFLLLKDVLHPKDYNIDNIDDGCNDFDNDDDYDGYDIDKDRDDDYTQYNYQYFTLNTDHELRQDFIKTWILPNGSDDFISTDDDDDDDDDCYTIYF